MPAIETKTNNYNWILVSIIIPTYNEQEYITDCLNSIFAQKIRQPYEIIVVDGKSTDRTTDIVKRFQEQHPNLLLLNNPRCLTPFALNIGLKHSSGKYIARVDAHSYIPPHYLQTCLKTFCETQKQFPNLAGVGGRWKCANKTVLGKAIFYAMNSWFGAGVSKYRYAKQPQLVRTILYAFYQKDIFNKIKFADESFPIAHDAELNWRLIKSGYRIYYDPKIYSYYHGPNSFSKLATKMFFYGKERMHLIQKHPSSFNLLQLIPMLFLFYIIVSPIVLIFKPFGIFLILYLLTNAYFSIKTAREKLSDSSLFWLLTIIFFLIHSSYGLGMIVQLTVSSKQS